MDSKERVKTEGRCIKQDGTLVPEWKQPEPELEFTAQQRKTNLYAKKNPLRVMPKDKRASVHATPLAHNAILRVRPNAIEVGTIQGEGGRGLIGLVALSFMIMPALMFSMTISGVYRGVPLWFISIPTLAGTAIFLMCMWLVRKALFGPPDYPVLFNRKTREVHVLPIKRLSFLKFWEKGEPGELRSYHWEHVYARTYRRLDVPGGTVARTETVMQLLCTTPEQPTQVDLMVDLGVTGTWSDKTQVQLWEHIRLYMEEGGPPLTPGDQLRKTNYAKLPDFPPHIVAAAGGPALEEAELAQWTAKNG